MKNIFFIVVILFIFTGNACSKKTGGTVNHAPVAVLAVTVKSASPFTVDFTITASDEDHDALTYKWDFGEGTTKEGAATETFTYPENKTFTIKVAVSDGK